MKKYIYIFCFALLPLLAAGSFADSTKRADGDLIIGNWKPSNGRSVIKIYKGTGEDGEDANKYYGKIIWLKEAYQDEDGKLYSKKEYEANPEGKFERVDVNNEDEEMRKKPLKGFKIVKDLEFIEIDGKLYTYDNGTIYDPNNGSVYNFAAEISKKSENQLDGRGYIGVSLFGRTDTWARLVKK